MSEESTLSPKAKSALKVIFLTLLLDLIGFSIIFPLFPAMLEYYIHEEAEGLLMGTLLRGIDDFSAWLGADQVVRRDVLFGGVLGSLYSLLQFVCAPILGSLSDRYGRRPVLLFSITGIALSYVLWFFAGRFWILVLARFLGGIMSANIATASAAVADVTPENQRSKGMAIIGVAFGIGFIMGPVLGGLASLIDLTQLWPGLEAWGVNPFSMPALVAFLLSLGNLYLVHAIFKETYTGERSRTTRIANPLRLLRTEPYPGVTQTNWSYFIFLTAFSGMEFSLTFLAAERLGFGPAKLGFLLFYVGIVLAVIQGTYVRKRADIVGPKRVALQGLACAIPSLAIIGYAQNLWVLLVGLTLLALASGQAMPCLSSLVSLYAPGHDQGRILGIFRSLGALARAVGPLIAATIYWRLGSDVAYYACAIAVVVPLAMVATLPKATET